MAQYYTVYCKRSVAQITPEQILAGVKNADLHTIAEYDDIPEGVILSAIQQLRIENIMPADFCHYRLCYRPDGMRQIDVERWETPEQVQAVAVEVLDGLKEVGHPAVDLIREHLDQVVDIVDSSFGWSKGEEMAHTLASEVARWFAEHFNGMIRAADGSWWKLGRHHEYQPLRS